MAAVIGDTIAEFWSFIVHAFAQAWPWVAALLALVSVAFLFNGRFAAKWLWPIALVVGATWAVRRWFWYYFFP